jgi:hypothetical protein
MVPPLKEQVKLLRNTVRGREDVFAIRWESHKTAKQGYSPACRNEWKARTCQKGMTRNACHHCAHADYITLQDEHIVQHLNGKIIIGIYPLLTD